MDFIPISKPSISDLEIEYVTKAVKSGWVSSLGKFINKFEKDFASFCGAKYAVATCNGTTALHLALLASGLKENDEIIIPDLTFIATANAVKYIGATPVIVDIEEDTLCIDPMAIEKAINPNTKAIIPVHLYGHPANMDKIIKLAKKHNLIVIEDAAEAHGATINGKRTGSFGNAGVFSFYGNKIITSGEGGMVTTNDQNLWQKMLYLRDHAMDKNKRYWHTEVGYNYRMTNLQASLGLAQFERIEDFLKRRKEIFSCYKNYLKPLKNLKLNFEAKWAQNVYWMICLEFDDFTEQDRDELMISLRQNNIDSRPFFYPLSEMPMYDKAHTPIAHKIYKKGINLPTYYDLKEEQIHYICEKVKELM